MYRGIEVERSDGPAVLLPPGTHDVTFEDCRFRYSGKSSPAAVVSAPEGAVHGIRFIRCSFAAEPPESGEGANGIKAVGKAGKPIEDWKLEQCEFTRIPRMAAEFQSDDEHGEGACRNIGLVGCRVSGTGAGGRHGMGFSFTGVGRAATVSGCRFSSCPGPAIEVVGFHAAILEDNDFAEGCHIPWSFSNRRRMARAIIRRNRTTSAATGRCWTENLHDSRIEDNALELGAPFHLVRSSGNSVVRNIIVANGGTCLRLEDVRTHTFAGNHFVSQGRTRQVVLITGRETAGNAFLGNRMEKGPGGTWVDSRPPGAWSRFDAPVRVSRAHGRDLWLPSLAGEGDTP